MIIIIITTIRSIKNNTNNHIYRVFSYVTN